jgi:hypothetical protein
MEIKFYKDVYKRFKHSLNIVPDPIEEIDVNDLDVGDTFISSAGIRFKKISDTEFENMKSSPLEEGEFIENLNFRELKIFWNLMNYVG